MPKYTWRQILHEKWGEGEREKRDWEGGEKGCILIEKLWRVSSPLAKVGRQRVSYLETKLKPIIIHLALYMILQGQIR